MSRGIGSITVSLLLILGASLMGFGTWPGLGWAVGQSEVRTKPATTDAAGRPEDQAAIRAAMQSFVKSFGQRDAKALVAHWTSLGEYQNENGKSVQGREGLEKGFTQFFAKIPEITAEVHTESLRFLSNDSAIEDGTVTIRRGPVAPASRAHYSVLFVREQGRWLMARLTESAADSECLADLGWLIGEWKSISGQGAEIRTSYSWNANKKFIHVRFTYAEKGHSLTGTQIIGMDPATGGIRTWTFEADGDLGVADWSRDGDHWELALTGTLANGKRLVETNVLRRVNNDTITWQSVNRTLDGADIPDLAPVKVTRIAPTK